MADATNEPLLIKIEDSPEPPLSTPPSMPSTNHAAAPAPYDPKDPEGFLRRCSGYNKKKGVRCSATIGKNSHHTKNSHSTYLPTCYAHRDQQTYAGWCQYKQRDGERCGKLFRWTPPYFELCAEHQGHPDTPCYFLKLPTELRLDIFRYLLPTRAIGSSTSLLHVDEDPDQRQPWFQTYAPRPSTASRMPMLPPPHVVERSTTGSVFPVPLMNLLLVNRRVHNEVKDLLYSSVPFTIDVRKDGTFMCGRRLLEPRRADGSSHFLAGDVEKMKEKFLKYFNWRAVKNYNVDILVENWKEDTNRGYHTFPWDEEVEIYDIRDYIGVVVSGILSKSQNLCKLNVRLGFSKFVWTEEEYEANIKTLVGPFERLRNVRQPRLQGVYEGTPQQNFMISLPIFSRLANVGITALTEPCHQSRLPTPLCSVPQLLAGQLLSVSTRPSFTKYRSNWERWISTASSGSLVRKSPIRDMFTELKEFYTKLAVTVPDVTARNGRHAFLHRARVAREQEDVEAFRHLRNELIAYWEFYLEQEERKKEDMNNRMSRMLDVDIYPENFGEDCGAVGGFSSVIGSAPGSSEQSPITLDADSMQREGIPMQGNEMTPLGSRARELQSRLMQQQQQQQLQHAHIRQVQRNVLLRRRCMLMDTGAIHNPQVQANNPQNAFLSQEQQMASNSQSNSYSSSVQIQTAGAYGVQTGQSSALHKAGAQAQTQATKALRPMVTHAPSSASSSSSAPIGSLYQPTCFLSPPGMSFHAPETQRKRGPDADVQTEMEMNGKRQRVDSGIGLGDDGHTKPKEFNENGDEIMVIDDDAEGVDVFREWSTEWDGKNVGGKGKGKSKESVGPTDIVWLN